MAINVGDNFSYQGKKYLDNRQSFKTLSELQTYANVPEGFIAYCEENKKRYEYVDGEWVEFTVDASVDVDTSIYAEKAYVDELIETHTHDEYLTEHQDISHLATKEEIPSLDGLATETYVQEQIANAELGGEEVDLSHLVTKDELEQKGYLTEHQDISHLATKAEIPSLDGYATEGYVREQIANAELGGEGPSIDTSNFATKDELKTKFDDVEVNEEETTDSQTALDFFANGEKVKTVYFSGGGGGSGAAAYISTTLEENVMVETGFNFDILIDFYSPNPGKGTLKVFVNDVDALSTPIMQGESTTTLSYEKLTKGTNKIVVYVLDRIGTMSNSLTFYVRYGSTELVGEFDSSLAYDYGANIRYYFTATALDTSLGLTFYMSIDGAVQNGVSCVSDVRGYFTFPNSLEAGGHYCECWVEDSNGGKSNVETFNLVILDTNTLAIVTETRNPSVEEGSQLVLDYRVYKKNETTFIIKTYVDEELISTGTCGLTTSYYKTTTLREGMHNIKIEAWDITETISDYITWTVIITPSTYTMLEPINAGSIFIASAKNRTNGDPNRETWTGYNQDKNAIDASLYNFAFNSESGWMDDQLFITGNSYVEVPIQPLANNARYGFTLDIEFSAKPIGVDDAEVLSLWNDVDNCGIKITTDQLILQSKAGNKCELYFSENEIVSAIFIIDRHEKTAKVYLNGVMCAAFALSDYTAEGVSYLEDFTVNGNLYLGKPGSNGYATIKNLRIYELALSSSEILNNFMSNEIDKAKQQALVNFQKGEDLPTVTVYCDFSGLGKDDKKYCDIVYNSPDPVKFGESFSLTGKYSQLQYQGTSSMQYPIKNYRLNPRDANGKVKIKLPFSQPESRFTLKADFMASGHWQNTGLTKWVNDNLYNYNENDEKSMNPAKWWAVQNGLDHNMYRECIYGFPCRLILVNDGSSPLNEGQQEPTPGNTKDMGIFNFNLDKECENTLGFTNDAFPNAVSMEVTANSDTSAGAFMSYEKPFPNTIDYFWAASTAAHLTMAIDIDKFNMRTVNIPSYNYETTNNIALAIYKADRTWIQNLSITPSTDYTFPDTAAYFTLRLNSIPESIIINDTTFNIGKEETENATAFASEPYYVSTGDANLELAYIQESFELRYGNEDVEGWGFMFGMSQQKTVDYRIQDNEWGTFLCTTRIPREYFGTGWGVYINSPGLTNMVLYDEAGNNHVVSAIDGDNRIEEYPYVVLRYSDLSLTSLTINGEVYHLGEETTDSTVVKEPYMDYHKDTSYGLKALIDWVDNSTDEQFVAEFEEHFHKDYTLRYFLLVMVLGMVDNLGKNMMLDSYDGKIWMPRFYDCDTICSYDNSGAIKFDVDIEMAQGYWNTSSSRLWTRVRDLFHDELVVKYNDMRQNGMSFESFMSYFYDEQIAKIPQRYYNMDADVKYLPYAAEYLGKAHGDGYEHLKRWLKNRIIFTDSLYDYAPSYTNDMITFRANTTEEMSVTIETYTPVYQHVSWYNGNMQKEKIAKGTQFTFKGFAQAATDQEVLVYGGSNIKRIIGISTMNPNSMLIGNATRLVELDISDCPILTDINSNKANFTPHTYLNKLDISNCPQLGGSLRLNYSPLIGEINAMNTAVTDLQLPSSIRNLHTLKIPGALTSLALNDGPVLSTLEFDGPNNLQSVNLTNCNALTNVVNFDMTQIPTVTLNNSYDADELYMSKTTNLSLVNMANIKKLIFIPNNEHETFNLTELRNCLDYTISAINCPNLKTFMTTAPYRDSCGIDITYEGREKLEYIETNGTQYFDTGYYPNDKTRVVMDVDMNNETSKMYDYLFGTQAFRAQFLTGELGFQATGCSITNDNADALARQVVTATSNSSSTFSLLIFAGYHQNALETRYYGSGKLYSFSIYEDETLIHDYIPAIDMDGVACLYDNQTKSFLYPTEPVAPGITLQEVFPNDAFCANTLDISNTKITDVNFLCTTDVYQLKLPDTVNNFICDSAYDLDTDYLPDGDFDTVHHKFIEAYTTDYPNNIYKYVDSEYEYLYSDVDTLVNSGEIVLGSGWDATNGEPILSETGYTYVTVKPIPVSPGTQLQFNSIGTSYSKTIYEFDLDGNFIQYTRKDQKLLTITLTDNTAFVRFLLSALNNAKGYQIIYKERLTPNLIPSAADGSLIFSMYAPNTNVAVPAEGIWDLYGLTFEEFYTYGMNNDIVVTDGNITMPHRYADYNVTIQNANIKPTNHPTMLYPLLVNENKPIVGTIDYSDYQGDDLSYAMTYANKSEVDISIPDYVMINSNHSYDIDKDSEYEYNDPRIIAKYTCNAKGVLPTFNSGYTDYRFTESDNGDETYTTRIIANSISNLPTSISFENIKTLLTVDLVNITNVTDLSRMFYECSNLTRINVGDWDTINVKNMNRLFTNCKALETLDVGNWNVENVTDVAFMFRGCSKLASLDVSNWDTASVEVSEEMFYGCSSLIMLDVSNWDTGNMTSLRNIFCNCSSLTSLNVSGWKTDKVTSMFQTFDGCSNLTSLDVGGWDTSNVTTMASIFRNCSKITLSGVNEWDTSNVTDISRAFYGCESLTSLDLSGWDTSKVSVMQAVFHKCAGLTSLNVTGWDTSNVTEMYNLFYNCSSLTSLDLTGWVTTKVTDTNLMFDKCYALASLKWTNWACTVDIWEVTKISADCVKDLLNNLAKVSTAKTITLGNVNAAKVTSVDILGAQMKGWTVAGANISIATIFADDTISGDSTVTECAVQLTNSLKTDRLVDVVTAYPACTTLYLFDDGTVTNLDNLFFNATLRQVTSVNFLADSFQNITSMGSTFRDYNTLVSLSARNLVTDKVTTLSWVFYGCSSLASLDISGWDTSKVTNMSSVFHGCRALTSLDLSDWDVSSATDMGSMFNGAVNLETLDITGWDTSSVRGMSAMFHQCNKLASVDLSIFDTANVTNMNQMFQNCYALTAPDIGGWDVSKVTSMQGMFMGCNGITSLDIGNWSTNALTNMGSLFYGCSGLTSLDVGRWNVGGVTSMSCTFQNCTRLESLDISGWTTGNVTLMNALFQGCATLTSLNIGEWDTGKVTNMGSMFYGCTKLASLDIWNWNVSNVTNILCMFYNCDALTSIDFTNWDTGKVTDFGAFCAESASLTSIIGLDLSTYTGRFGGAATNALRFVNCSSLTTIKNIDVSFTSIMATAYPNSITETYWIEVGWKWFTGLNNLTDITFTGQVGLYDSMGRYIILSGCDTSNFTYATWQSFASIFPTTSTPKTIVMGKSQANLDNAPDAIKADLTTKGYTLVYSAT